jgi:hypothetical protein
MRCHGFQKKTKTASHVKKSPGTPRHKPFQEIPVHSRAGFVPVEVVLLCDCITPELIVMRIGRKRREDMTALTASENIYTELVENRVVQYPSA